MKQILTYGKYFLKEKLRRSCCSSDIRYKGIGYLSRERTSQWLQEKIVSGEPFLVARFGAVELFAASAFEFDVQRQKGKAMAQLGECAGFFPEDIALGDRFNRVIRESTAQIDLLAAWQLRFEEYYLRRYGKKDCVTAALSCIEPWTLPENPWTRALKGKKVLVIHPFADTIRSQYQRREQLFPGTEILPAFELKILKAVQTIAGNKDERFSDWFEALDWMYDEAMKIDFDIAILGCGAYGMPLAAKLKQAGKQAVHLGGATQLLFGIKGKRWDESNMRSWYRESWIYPSEHEKPQNAAVVENGCYW